MSECTTMMTPDLVHVVGKKMAKFGTEDVIPPQALRKMFRCEQYIVYSIGVGTYLRGTARAVPLKSGTAQLGLSRPTFWQKIIIFYRIW